MIPYLQFYTQNKEIAASLSRFRYLASRKRKELEMIRVLSSHIRWRVVSTIT